MYTWEQDVSMRRERRNNVHTVKAACGLRALGACTEQDGTLGVPSVSRALRTRRALCVCVPAQVIGGGRGCEQRRANARAGASGAPGYNMDNTPCEEGPPSAVCRDTGSTRAAAPPQRPTCERTPCRTRAIWEVCSAQCDARAMSGWILTVLCVRRRAHEDPFPSAACLCRLSPLSTGAVDGGDFSRRRTCFSKGGLVLSHIRK